MIPNKKGREEGYKEINMAHYTAIVCMLYNPKMKF